MGNLSSSPPPNPIYLILCLCKTASTGDHGKVKKNIYEMITGNGLQAASKDAVSGHFVPVMFPKTTVYMLYPHQKDNRDVPDRYNDNFS